ncbi:acyltransferase family protein [Vibrio parahaemolyticus]|uniref:acyltransferase family protein n=1 Tax=Vibrio parahaemolyticus TaxID=670 RepID=UPI0007A0A7F6|nr:acyltransferase [Vibrio parahaemolyticus]EGR1141529.1 acyltransferase [Vibrio parahaemolyticus]ELB1647699.1 acyltransferase [Vibrio parahaemolyticus]KYY50748.1 hypothetical protein AWQ17_09275 [Vibrio parahaemolyticus]
MNKIVTLDYLRFFAALSVVFYHYLFRGIIDGELSVYVVDFTKYGYLGVQLFFMISGFVIYKSLERSSVYRFCKGRFLRLYPTYWLCLILTIIVSGVLNNKSYHIGQILFNLTMFQDFFNVEHIDGVYWTLSIELIFYFWSVIYLFTHKKNIYAPIVVALLLSTLNYFYEFPKIVKYFFLMEWAPYFLSGIGFYLFGLNKTIQNLLVILFSMLLSCAYAVHQYEIIASNYRVVFSSQVVISIILFFYLVFFVMVLAPSPKSMVVGRVGGGVGGLTFPLYLTHQIIGYIFITILYSHNESFYLSVCIVTVGMLFVSFIINDLFEKRFLKNTLLKLWNK